MSVFATNRLIGTLASLLALLLLALVFTFTAVDRDTLADAMPATASHAAQKAALEQSALQQAARGHAAARQSSVDLASLDFADASVKQNVLWLARVIYSETKRPAEQELVAWVVRNRVETAYRGQRTYRGVVLDPWQFSAFNPNGTKRAHYMGLDLASRARGWATAVQIAYDVVHAPAYERPFTQSTRHFYSEISMVGRSRPDWAEGKRPVSLDREIDPKRFRFFAEIA